MKIEHLLHKHGGRITEIRTVAHATNKKEPAFWFYEGSVKWDDGSESEHVEIAPWAVCYDQDDEKADAEYHALTHHLTTYLREKGAWNGRIWKPKEKFGHRHLEAAVAA